MKYYICIKCGVITKKVDNKYIEAKREWLNDKEDKLIIKNCKGKCKNKGDKGMYHNPKKKIIRSVKKDNLYSVRAKKKKKLSKK